MAPNQNGMITKSTNDECDNSSLVNRSSRIVVSNFSFILKQTVMKLIQLSHDKNIFCYDFQKDRPNRLPYDTKPGEKPYKLELVWRNILGFIYLHGAAIYAFRYPMQLSTFVISELTFFKKMFRC